MIVAGHVDVRRTAPAPLDTVWRVANDPAVWAAGGHPVRNLRRCDGRTLFDVTTPPDGAGRSWTFSVERVEDEASRTVYSRRIGTSQFRYSHTLFSYTPVDGGTEMRCVVDFEMSADAGVTDAAVAESMRHAIHRNMGRVADLLRTGREE